MGHHGIGIRSFGNGGRHEGGLISLMDSSTMTWE